MGKIVKKRSVLLLFFLSVLLSGCSTKEKEAVTIPENSASGTKIEQKIMSDMPTVFIHGYSGGTNSFKSMIQRLIQEGVAESSVTLTVSSKGEISENGKWQKDGNSLVKVVFEDNKNHEWQQAEWIQTVLDYLNETQGVEKVNLIGHSMGGVSIMRYLTNYGADGSVVQINKIVAIGAPFNEFVEEDREPTEISEQGPDVASARFTEYEGNFENYPKNIALLNVAGDLQENNGDDGIVPVASVAAINYLFVKNQIPYEFTIIPKAEHSGLLKNEEVDRDLLKFLWLSPEE